jgi:hypothetical protein
MKVVKKKSKESRVSNPALIRIARRNNLARVRMTVWSDARDAGDILLHNLMVKIDAIMMLNNKKVVTSEVVNMALESAEIPMYG